MTSTYEPPVWRPSKGPKTLLTLGAVAVVISVIVVVVGIGLFGGGTATSTNDPSEFRDDFDAELAVPSTTSVHLEAKGYDVVAIGTGLTVPGTPKPGGGTYLDTRAKFPRPALTITGPDGNGVEVKPQHNVLTYTGDGYDLVSLNWIEIDTAGTYLIAVRGQGPVTAVGIGDANTRDDGAITMALGGGVLALFGVGGTVIGVISLIAGFTWRRIDRNRGRRQPAGWPPPNDPSAPHPPRTPLPPPPPPPGSSSTPWTPQPGPNE